MFAGDVVVAATASDVAHDVAHDKSLNLERQRRANNSKINIKREKKREEAKAAAPPPPPKGAMISEMQ